MISYGYIRVSGKGQVEGDGPDRQREAIEKFCREFALGEPLIYFDAAVSGTREAMDRPKFVEMLEAIERLRKALPSAEVCMVVECVDRMARELLVAELLLAQCAKRKIKVFAANLGRLEDLAAADEDPTRKALRQIMEVMAEWEKTMLVRKLRAARNRIRLRKGRCEGPLPYGHHSNPKEYRTRKRMVELHKEGRSFADIAELMTYEGFRRRNGDAWSKAAVYQVLMRRGNKTLRGSENGEKPQQN